MKALNKIQQQALDWMPKHWGPAPRVHIATLLSLLERNLVECRPTPGFGHVSVAFSGLGYKSGAYQWRRSIEFVCYFGKATKRRCRKSPKWASTFKGERTGMVWCDGHKPDPNQILSNNFHGVEAI